MDANDNGTYDSRIETVRAKYFYSSTAVDTLASSAEWIDLSCCCK
jgi:hypothetical protein